MMMGPVGSELTRILPSKGWVSVNFSELWKFRELLYFLTWRDVKVRYKQTVLGILWAVLQPLLTMVVFSIFFGKLAKVPSDGIPYPIFSYSGLVPWAFFATSLSQASNSVVASQNLIKKVYFPRLVIPLSSTLSALVDFAIAFAVLLVMMAFYGMMPTSRIFWLPFLLILTGVTSLGVSLWLTTLNVRYRDVRYVLPLMTQLWLVATPIAYPSSLMSENWRYVYALNPMVGVVDGFRWALLGTPYNPGSTFVVPTLAAIFILITGVIYFRRMEQSFADII